MNLKEKQPQKSFNFRKNNEFCACLTKSQANYSDYFGYNDLVAESLSFNPELQLLSKSLNPVNHRKLFQISLVNFLFYSVEPPYCDLSNHQYCLASKQFLIALVIWFTQLKYVAP